jgi:predicted acylesterase/phospholipase RssA
MGLGISAPAKRITVRTKGLLVAAAMAIGGAVGCTSVDFPRNDLFKPSSTFTDNSVDRAENFVDRPPLAAHLDDGRPGPSTNTSYFNVPDPDPVAPAYLATSAVAQATRMTRRPAERDGFFVGVAISGGGSRSANFAAACMLELDRIGMLDRVDCISAVSGGCLPATYYCTAPNSQWTVQAIQDKLTHPFATDLIVAVFMPWNWIALTFSDYDRSDILAARFQSVLFTGNGHGLTFADLRHDRPRLLINATDLQSGKPFVFSNRQFDELNSDLARYPLAWACAASSAVPAAMHPVTLRDYSTKFPQYRHLIDGGIVDNLGVQELVASYEAQANRDATAYKDGAVFIIIDAGTEFDAKLSSESDVGWLENVRTGLGLSSTALLNRASRATLSDLIVMHSAPDRPAAQLQADLQQLRQNHYLETKDRRGKPVWIVHVSLSQVSELGNLPYVSFGTSVNSIDTYFNIDPTEAYNLYKAANLLFKQRFDERFRAIERVMDRER